MTIFRRGDCRDFTGDIRVDNHRDFSTAAGVVVVTRRNDDEVSYDGSIVLQFI
jgi:hypothetical protein